MGDRGTRLRATRLRPDRLRAKVHQAIGLREGATCVQEAFAAVGGPSAAANAVETRLLKQEHHRNYRP
jgi:UDP:flavonoid glycosyltransferase YjiC (YdhE family)